MTKRYHGLELAEALEYMYDVVGELYKIGVKPETLLKEVSEGS